MPSSLQDHFEQWGLTKVSDISNSYVALPSSMRVEGGYMSRVRTLGDAPYQTNRTKEVFIPPVNEKYT